MNVPSTGGGHWEERRNGCVYYHVDQSNSKITNNFFAPVPLGGFSFSKGGTGDPRQSSSSSAVAQAAAAAGQQAHPGGGSIPGLHHQGQFFTPQWNPSGGSPNPPPQAPGSSMVMGTPSSNYSTSATAGNSTAWLGPLPRGSTPWQTSEPGLGMEHNKDNVADGRNPNPALWNEHRSTDSFSPGSLTPPTPSVMRPPSSTFCTRNAGSTPGPIGVVPLGPGEHGWQSADKYFFTPPGVNNTSGVGRNNGINE